MASATRFRGASLLLWKRRFLSCLFLALSTSCLSNLPRSETFTPSEISSSTLALRYERPLPGPAPDVPPSRLFDLFLASSALSQTFVVKTPKLDLSASDRRQAEVLLSTETSNAKRIGTQQQALDSDHDLNRFVANVLPAFELPLEDGRVLSHRNATSSLFYPEQTLFRKLSKRGDALDLEARLRLSVQAARGLAALHDIGVKASDLKPENAFLEGETVKLADFDGAPGTDGFLAPERGSSATFSTDVFALGVLIGEIFGEDAERHGLGLRGKSVSFSDTKWTQERENAAWRVSGAAGHGVVGQRLEKAVSAMLAKEPEQRPTAREVVAALSDIEVDQGRGESFSTRTPHSELVSLTSEEDNALMTRITLPIESDDSVAAFQTQKLRVGRESETSPYATRLTLPPSEDTSSLETQNLEDSVAAVWTQPLGPRSTDPLAHRTTLPLAEDDIKAFLTAPMVRPGSTPAETRPLDSFPRPQFLQEDEPRPNPFATGETLPPAPAEEKILSLEAFCRACQELGQRCVQGLKCEPDFVVGKDDASVADTEFESVADEEEEDFRSVVDEEEFESVGSDSDDDGSEASYASEASSSSSEASSSSSGSSVISAEDGITCPIGFPGCFDAEATDSEASSDDSTGSASETESPLSTDSKGFLAPREGSAAQHGRGPLRWLWRFIQNPLDETCAAECEDGHNFVVESDEEPLLSNRNEAMRRHKMPRCNSRCSSALRRGACRSGMFC